ncbi:MAG TPA: hypothetical protein VFN81_08635 [Sphingomicrobium sp.]|nr:hypothetical protein [Sphingomicrobium sp.]
MEHPCFQELKTMIEEIKAESIGDEDRVPTSDLNVAVIAEARGVRKGLTALQRRIEEMLD